MGYSLRHIHLPNYSYKDYCLWEGNWELINGIPFSMAPIPVFKHQDVNTRILVQLRNKLVNYKHCTAIMPIDWKINENTIVQPDVSVLCEKVTGSFLSSPPMLIFEIFSPSTIHKDRTIKFDIYESQGVKYYVMVNVDKKEIEIFELKKQKYELMKKTKNENFVFHLKKCKVNFEFKTIWEN